MLCSTLIGFSFDSFVYPPCADPPPSLIFLLHSLKPFPRLGLILIRKWLRFALRLPGGVSAVVWFAFCLTTAPLKRKTCDAIVYASATAVFSPFFSFFSPPFLEIFGRLVINLLIK